jgi:hypothetical protein
MANVDIQAVKDLVVHSFYGTNPDPSKFSNSDIKNALSEEIHKIASDYNSYRRNKNDLFEIMQEAYTEILPKSVEQFIGTFAEVRTVPMKTKAQFLIKRGRRRAKQFITTVALSGVYESFRLDSDTFELGGRAIGGAAYIDFERYLCGDEDIAESASLLMEGLQDAIYREIQKALLAAVNAEDRPAANKAYSNGFDPELMSRLISVAQTYSTNGGATIYATPEFVAAMGPDAVGPGIYGTRMIGGQLVPPLPSEAGYATPVYNPRNIDEIAQYGRIKTFRGTPIVELPQSFTDERNDTYVMNPAAAYIFPNGDNKPVKVVFEGPTQVDEWQHRDRSFEVEVYQRVGVAIITNHDWCIYINGDLMDQEKYPTQYQISLNADTFNDRDRKVANDPYEAG